MTTSPAPRLLLVCSALTVSALAAFSASGESPSQIPPPNLPIVKTPPLGSIWSVEAVYPTVAPIAAASGFFSPAPSNKTLTGNLEMRVGTNGISEGTVVTADGRKDTYYVFKDQILEKTRNTGLAFFLSVDPDSDIFDLVSASFPVVAWVSLKNYAGVDKIDSVPYYKFHQLPDSHATGLTFPGERTAWIRISDGYPWKVQFDQMVFTFSQVTPFPNSIDLPREYQAALDRQTAKERAVDLLRQ